MGFTLASTTESQQELERVAAPSPDWKIAPVVPDDPPGPGDIPKSIPQKLYNELRKEQAKEKERAGPVLLQDDGRDTSKSARLEEIEAAIRKAKQAESRKSAAESRVAELKAQIGNGETETPAPVHERAPRPGAKERHERAIRKYGDDFSRAIDAADRAGVLISERAITAIESMRNDEDILFYLATNPEICNELLTNADSATGRIGEISSYLMRNPQVLRNPQVSAQAQHPHVDQETVRHNELLHAHEQRMAALRAADPAAAKAIDAGLASAQSSGIGITPFVHEAVLAQSNSQHVARFLIERPEERERLNGLHPTAAITEVGKISERLEARAQRGRVRAPEPISPVGGSSSRSEISLDQADIHTFMRARNRQEFLKKREGRL
jgi:hypothetical protein